jgi:hypothetical protein
MFENELIFQKIKKKFFGPIYFVLKIEKIKYINIFFINIICIVCFNQIK